ncbi:MAG: GTPase Era [Alphaproteobacteria bacterium]|nr:GTPase Era [Alphaproteobacteria bacterium]
MSETRCGFVAMLGAPNAGKSTLVNALVGAKVAIVSPKPQTTRSRIAAIATEGATQVVYADLPGVFAPKRRLDRAMVDAAWRGVADADLTLLVVDAAAPGEAAEAVRDELARRGHKAVLVLNKVDIVERSKLLGLAKAWNEAFAFSATFMVSALTGDGVADLRAHVVAAMPAGPWHYPEDQLVDLPSRLLAAEITREQVFLQLHQELPYSTHVETETWTDQDDGSVRIEQTVTVEREGQKRIVIGSGGMRIKAIGQRARTELEAILGRRVHLFLNVKVTEGWAEKRGVYSAWGLDYNAR